MDPLAAPTSLQESGGVEGLVASVEVAPPADAPIADPPPIDSGNISFMLAATAFTSFMVPLGLSLFYGGLAQRKNFIATLSQTAASFYLVLVLWAVYGHSFAFSEGNAFIGGFDKILLAGLVIHGPAGTPVSFATASTFSKGVLLPELLFSYFQGTFAAITTALVAPCLDGLMRFKLVMIFAALWCTFCYLPMAHMVWYWPGADAFVAGVDVAALTATAGYIWQMGGLDTAGGSVVHINASTAGFVLILALGRRLGTPVSEKAVLLRLHNNAANCIVWFFGLFGKEYVKKTAEKIEDTPPQAFSAAISTIGALVLTVGWIFGFNAGSNLEANSNAALIAANSAFAAATGMWSWYLLQRKCEGEWSFLGLGAGLVSGLVAITPACGNVGACGALAIGFITGPSCYLACGWFKKFIGYDDAFDLIGVHFCAGVIGTVLTGVFANPELGGTGYVVDWVTMEYGYSYWQIWIQIKMVGVTVAFSGCTTAAILLAMRLVFGPLRVTKKQEPLGLDRLDHKKLVEKIEALAT